MRYIIGLFVTIALLVLLIVLIISGGNNKRQQVKQTAKELSSYSTTDAEVRLVVGGPIKAIPTYQQVEITVGRDQVTYVQLTGYNGDVAVSKSYANTQNSYYNFLRALTTAGFTLGDTNPKLTNNTGLCPLGNRYNFQLFEGDKTLQNFWATSCGGARTYRGDVPVTIQLFQNQIPDLNELVQTLNISF